MAYTTTGFNDAATCALHIIVGQCTRSVTICRRLGIDTMTGKSKCASTIPTDDKPLQLSRNIAQDCPKQKTMTAKHSQLPKLDRTKAVWSEPVCMPTGIQTCPWPGFVADGGPTAGCGLLSFCFVLTSVVSTGANHRHFIKVHISQQMARVHVRGCSCFCRRQHQH